MQSNKPVYAPATPEKAMGDWRSLSSPDHHNTDQSPSSVKAKHRASLHEPSPASTYGDTVVGDSLPVTPQGTESTGVGRRSVKSLSLTPLLRTGSQGHSSPTTGITTDLSFQSAGHTRSSDAHPLKSFKRSVTERYEPGQETVAERTRDPQENVVERMARVHVGPSPPSSPASPIQHQVVRRANGPPDENNNDAAAFVIRERHHLGEDPFFVSPQHSSSSHHVSGTTIAQPILTPTRRSGSPNRSRVSFREPIEMENAQSVSDHPSPRIDRTGEPISAENAQAVLPPSACVFVANLASVRTDEQLENSVKQVFDQFGTVYVKIRRDNRGMPYAFCQYENDEDARQAILGGRRRLIDGRPCRTEPAKVNRSLYLSKLTGGAVTESEARRVLHDYGEIDSLWWSSRTEREMYQLPEGVWVKFAFFQDCRDAQSSFRDNALYRLEQPSTPSERGAQPRTPPASRAGWTTRGATRAEAQTPQNSTYVAHRQDVDRRSVFIGNLPETMTRDRLVELLSPFGTIMSVDVVTKPSAHRNGPNVFAFVEFSMREEALHVIEAHNHRIIDGNRVRVEAKDSSAQGPRRFMPDHFVQGITNDTRNVLNHLTRSGLPVDFQQVAFNHPPGGGTTGHTQGLTIRNCPVYSPVQAYPGNSQDYTTAQYGALTPAAAHAARDMARVTATLAQIAAEGEAAGGTISNGSAFAHSGYPYVGLYDHGQNLAMPMHPGSPPIPEPGATMYPAFQQYPQSLAPFQYPQYYPVGYYQYSNGMESVQQAQYFPQSAVSAPEQEQHSGPTSPHSAHQQESDNLVDR